MARFVSKDGKHSIETSNPRERVELLAQGYREQKPKPAPVRQVDTGKTDGK